MACLCWVLSCFVFVIFWHLHCRGTADWDCRLDRFWDDECLFNLKIILIGCHGDNWVYSSLPPLFRGRVTCFGGTNLLLSPLVSSCPLTWHSRPSFKKVFRRLSLKSVLLCLWLSKPNHTGDMTPELPEECTGTFRQSVQVEVSQQSVLSRVRVLRVENWEWWLGFRLFGLRNCRSFLAGKNFSGIKNHTWFPKVRYNYVYISKSILFFSF